MKRAPMDPNRGRAGRAHANAAYATEPEKTRRVSPLSVPCPSCGAEVDEKCTVTGNSGHHLNRIGEPCSPHPPRKRLAIRRDNERREAEGTFRAVRPGERVPGSLEDPSAPECPHCQLHIKLSPKTRSFRSHTSRGGVPGLKSGPPCPGSLEKPEL